LSNPASKLKIIGITGTKGKTTTAFLIEHFLASCGYKTALIGSIKNKIINEQVESELTTPESDYLQMFFDQCVKRGVDYVVMEVSSHSIALERIHGIFFDAVGFTNLAPEHIDFHKNIKNYFQTKYRLFDQVKRNGSIVVNVDDEWGKKASLKFLKDKEDFKNLITFGFKGESLPDYRFENFCEKPIEIFFKKQNLFLKNSYMFGQFNLYNIVLAFLICKKLGLKDFDLQKALKEFKGVPGRLQMHSLKNGAISFVDFAHNPSSFEAVLKALKPLTDDLIVIFGCGGDRDKTKRPVMGKLASIYCDKIILTDDNPRSEDRDKIIDEIYSGVLEKNKNETKIIPDRKKAIAKAVELSRRNSIIAILGKGHETVYLCKNKKYKLDDFEEVSFY
jgi:UDP-N-acetylmuramoyl-L-alanyl-D-glutamate--2,6-diaminopimelate ligase